MATVTCITPNCNTELAARQLRCPNCHAFRPRLSQLTARRDAEPPDEHDAEDADAGNAERTASGGEADPGTAVSSTTGTGGGADGRGHTGRAPGIDADAATSTGPGVYGCDHAAREPGAITCPTCGELLVEPRRPDAPPAPTEQVPPQQAGTPPQPVGTPPQRAEPPPWLAEPHPTPTDTSQPESERPPWLAEPAPTPQRQTEPTRRRTGRLPRSPFRRGRDRAQTREWRLMSGLARLRRPMSLTWRVAVGGTVILLLIGVDRSVLWTPWSLFPLVALALVLRAQQQATLLAPWELSAAVVEQAGRIDRPDGRRQLEMPMSRSLERTLRDGFSNAVFRAQFGALAALCLFVLWCLGSALAAGGDSSGGVELVGFLFALPTGFALLAAGLFRVAQRGEPPPGELAIIDLRQRDRRTLRRGTTVCATGIVPMSVGFVLIQMQGLPEVEPAGASLPVVLITLWLLGLWAPAAVTAFHVAVRGQWPQRRISLRWAARLAAVSVGALVIGEVIAIVVLGAGFPVT